MTCHDPRQCDLFTAAAHSPHQRLTAIGQAPPLDPDDFASIKGQEVAKRALQIALTGGHPILLAGPTGCGKTLLLDAASKIADAHDWDFGGEEWTLPDDPAPRDPGRFALQVDCPPVSASDLTLPPIAESSAEIAARVAAARAVIDETMIEMQLDEPAQKLLDDAAKAMRLSDDQQWTAIEVAESIAALAGEVHKIRRIHIAEALSYARHITPPTGPEPPEPPAPQPEPSSAVEAWSRGRETVAVDPKRLDHPSGDIGRSYSAQSLCEQGAVKSPFRFQGGEWVNTGGSWHGGKGFLECYRIVPVAAFDGPSAPYRDHDWRARGDSERLGNYHGMSARHGGREIVLQGPPLLFVGGEPEQSALL